MAVVYRHIRLDKNEVFYIGIGKEEKRAYDKRGRNRWWKNITSISDYETQILFDDLNWEEACEKEKEFITLYGRKDLGLGTLCNMTDGGDGTLGTHKDNGGEKNPMFGRIQSENTKKIISEKAKKRQEYYLANGREFHPQFNKYVSSETRNKLSKSIKKYFETNTHNRKGIKNDPMDTSRVDKYKKTVQERGSHKMANNSRAIKFIYNGKVYGCLKELWLEIGTSVTYRFWIKSFDRSLITIINE